VALLYAEDACLITNRTIHFLGNAPLMNCDLRLNRYGARCLLRLSKAQNTNYGLRRDLQWGAR
jgi:hypothetical protein